MNIESGTTSDRRNRVLIMLVMCLVFSGWFSYDGFVGYPAKNIKWARQFLPTEGKLAKLQNNPKVLTETLEEIRRQMAPTGTVGGGQTLELQDLTDRLGEPALKDAKFYYYIGPAAFAAFEVEDDKVKAIDMLESQREPSESDIRNQKGLGLLLLLVAVGLAVHLRKVIRGRVILDDTGLQINGKKVTWEQMESLDVGRFEAKGWVVLLCQSDRGSVSIRLDSYAIERFDEIVAAICDRKGFTSPL